MHISHIQQASTKIDDIINSTKTYFVSIQEDVAKRIRTSQMGLKLDESTSQINKKIESSVKDKEIAIERIKGRLDTFFESLKELKKDLAEHLKHKIELADSSAEVYLKKNLNSKKYI